LENEFNLGASFDSGYHFCDDVNTDFVV